VSPASAQGGATGPDGAGPPEPPIEPAAGVRDHTNRTRAGSFGSDATGYDAHRPDYPAEAIDAVLRRVAGRGPVGRGRLDVLDIGTGTGKLARAIAARGHRVLGLDVDARMTEVARSHGIEVEVGGFEDWDAAGRRFDAIVAGQAWHWLRPDIAAPKAAGLLRPGGVLGALWNLYDPNPSVAADLRGLYARVAPQLSGSVLIGSAASGIEAQAAALRETGAFGDVQVLRIAWESRFTAEAWLDLAATHSDHRALDPQTWATLRRETTALVARHGGTLDIDQHTAVILATEPR
jgi:SAM-dependent methyltransferase